MNKYIAEFLGTALFLYVILAIGSPIAVGLALTLVIIMVGRVSGGHFNPAVSVMMAVAGRLSMKDLLPYVLAQVSGGLVALEMFKRL